LNDFSGNKIPQCSPTYPEVSPSFSQSRARSRAGNRRDDLHAIQSRTAKEPDAPRLFTRAEALALLKIGETTLHWLQRTGKLKAIRIGSRVLFNATQIERIATRGASLTRAEKEAAIPRDGGRQPKPPTREARA
jgi:hypothetical protein